MSSASTLRYALSHRKPIDFSRDPVKGIKGDIKFALKNKRHRAAVILIYAGIDAMAYLSMPAGQQDVKPQDFIRWANGYIRFPCSDQITGEDLYGARCGMVHTYGAASKASRTGKCRQIIYADRLTPEVVYNPEVSEAAVMVSLEALARAFFDGVDRSLVDVFADPEKRKIAEYRLSEMAHLVPWD